MFFVRGGVHQQIVDVHDHILNVFNHSFHESLKTGRAPKQAHGAGNPLELAHARHSEGSVGPCSWVQDHLPETCG